MELHFLGTSSSIATPTRHNQCLAVRLHGGAWVFDCGEGGSHRLRHARIAFGTIRRVFISHLHADHVLGLPGLILNNAGPDAGSPLQVYGPVGTRKLLDGIMSGTHARSAGLYAVHDLVDAGQMDHDDDIEGQVAHDGVMQWNMFFKEKTNHDTQVYHVESRRIYHTITCHGFVLREGDKPGSVDVEKLKAFGIKPGPAVKLLKTGGVPILTPDGRKITMQDVCAPTMRGRKLVILSDTHDPRPMIPISGDCDVLVHECTYSANLPQFAHRRGHSTSLDAGNFARIVRAKNLIITHFSPRYGDITINTRLLAEAREAYRSQNVTAASDFLEVHLPDRQRRSANTEEAQQNEAHKTAQNNSATGTGTDPGALLQFPGANVPESPLSASGGIDPMESEEIDELSDDGESAVAASRSNTPKANTSSSSSPSSNTSHSENKRAGNAASSSSSSSFASKQHQTRNPPTTRSSSSSTKPQHQSKNTHSSAQSPFSDPMVISRKFTSRS